MNNFFTLTKVFFLSGFNVNRKKKNQKSAFALFAMTLGIFAFVSVMLSISFVGRLKEVGISLEYFLGIMLLLSFMFNFILSINQVQSIIFNTKDYEFLESIPVTKTTIISSKLFSFYLINAAEDLALIIPACAIYLGFGGVISSALMTLLTSVFISIIPILLSALIGALSALLASKSKYPNLINIIISALLFFAFFIPYMFLMYGDSNAISGAMDSIFLLRWMNLGIQGEYIYSLYFILTNLAAFVLVTLFIVFIYRPVNAWLNSKNSHVDYDKVKKNAKDMDFDIDHILLKKEWNMIVRRPQYFLNCLMGVLMYIIFGLIFLLAPTLFIGGMEDITQETQMKINEVMAFMVPSFGLVMCSITAPSACSISFEGKYGYEMLRTYPVSKEKIIKSKLLMSLIFEGSLSLFASAVLSMVLIFRGYYQIFILIPVYIYPLLATILTCILGMLTGLRWPKLEFENEAQVMKNSAAANFLLLFSGLPAFVLFMVSFGLTLAGYYMNLSFLIYGAMGLTIVLYGVAIFIFYKVLKKKGAELFDRIILKH